MVLVENGLALAELDEADVSKAREKVLINGRRHFSPNGTLSDSQALVDLWSLGSRLSVDVIRAGMCSVVLGHLGE